MIKRRRAMVRVYFYSYPIGFIGCVEDHWLNPTYKAAHKSGLLSTERLVENVTALVKERELNRVRAERRI